jgi:lipoprotein-anchoring transpeptidase ErfK/SrfK
LARVPGLACMAVLASIATARAGVDVRIQIGTQTATVAVDGATIATWPVSTARSGYRTPRGSFRPYLLERMHYSSIYDNSPMPYSTFFYGGFAIHGTLETRNLGRPVSHGCIRLSPVNARTLYDLIRSRGLGSTSIVISD